MRVGVAKILAVTAMAAVAACAPTPPPPAPPPPPPPPAPAPAPTPMIMPVPPNSASPTLVIPAVDATGRRMTPNIDLSPEQALWQLRIGLNVAALSCRGPDEATLVAHYSSFLRNNQRAIAAAERWVIRDQGLRNGTNGIAARDALSTRLYNYFAQPPVKTEFCVRATQIMALAAVEPTANILTFASTQLALLDEPFIAFYANYARYQADFAVWQAQQRYAATALTPGVPAAPAGATQPGLLQGPPASPAPGAPSPAPLSPVTPAITPTPSPTGR